jgi:hypothetical protein
MIVTKVPQPFLKKLIIGNAADFSHATRFVVDLSGLKDSGDEIIEAIGAFKSMYPDTRVIVIADHEPENSYVLIRLLKLNVYDVLRTVDGFGIKKCLTTGMTREEAEVSRDDKPDTNAQHEAVPAPVAQAAISQPALEKITANRDFKRHKQFVTVAVCSTEPHIGATHHALLLTKFLYGVGFRACYLEANERRDIVCLARAYPVNANEHKHLLQFEGVDMYFDFTLPEIIGAGYDFYIFDLGRFSEIEAASFLTKDIKIIIGGVKAWEMSAYNTIFETVKGCKDVKFILNSVPATERSGIKSLMSGYKTYFSDYAPYPFSSDVNTALYANLFKDYLSVERTAPGIKKRAGQKGFFVGKG